MNTLCRLTEAAASLSASARAGPGIKTGTLIVNSDAVNGPHRIDLTGTGTVTGPFASLSVTSLSFSPQAVGTRSVDQRILVTNTGVAPLHFTNIGGGFPNFRLDGLTTCEIETPLGVGGTCIIYVTFLPSGPGIQTASLILNSDAVNSPHVINLTGTGVLAADVFFSDDFGTGGPGWSMQPPWAVTTEGAHSGARAWSDSPGGSYGAMVNVVAVTPVINLTGAASPADLLAAAAVCIRWCGCRLCMGDYRWGYDVHPLGHIYGHESGVERIDHRSRCL